MSSEAQRRKARDDVAAYHEAQLARLVAQVGEVIDKFRAIEIDAFAVDLVLFRSSRAAKELWTYGNLGK